MLGWFSQMPYQFLCLPLLSLHSDVITIEQEAITFGPTPCILMLTCKVILTTSTPVITPDDLIL